MTQLWSHTPAGDGTSEPTSIQEVERIPTDTVDARKENRAKHG